MREREKAHRRLTRIYGFVGLANKESARETGFSGRHSLPWVESLVAVESTKTLDPRDISDIVARVNANGEFMATLGFTSRGYAQDEETQSQRLG